jgi:hypothetical protein
MVAGSGEFLVDGIPNNRIFSLIWNVDLWRNLPGSLESRTLGGGALGWNSIVGVH